jgi:hypothetical protein
MFAFHHREGTPSQALGLKLTSHTQVASLKNASFGVPPAIWGALAACPTYLDPTRAETTLC